MKTLEQINVRMAEIKAELDTDEADVDALSTEVEELKSERQAILDKAEKRQAMLDSLSDQNTTVVEKPMVKEERKMNEILTPEETIKTDAYERAFAKTMVARAAEQRPVLTSEEQRALDTTNGAVLIPHTWLQTIEDQIRETHSLLNDITWQRISQIVEIPRRLAIVSGDAAVMEEGTCPVGEVNDFDSIQVDLIEIQKMLEITAKMGMLLPEAFKNWLIAEVRDRIGAKMAEELVKAIKADILPENNLTAATAGTVTVADVVKLFGAADGVGTAKVYANRKTIYQNLFAIEGLDTQGSFLNDVHGTPSMNLLGAQVREESAMADGELMIVFPQEVFLNVPAGIRVKQMEDICFKLQIAGIAFMGARLKYRKGAAVLTVGDAVEGA